jgi:hypothetical protein
MSYTKEQKDKFERDFKRLIVDEIQPDYNFKVKWKSEKKSNKEFPEVGIIIHEIIGTDYHRILSRLFKELDKS